MREEDCAQGDDGREDKDKYRLKLPEFAVLLWSNKKKKPKILAMFCSLLDADRYTDQYRKLRKWEVLSVEVNGKDGTRHIAINLTHRDMECVFDDGRLLAVPNEMAPMYGDNWVNRHAIRVR